MPCYRYLNPSFPSPFFLNLATNISFFAIMNWWCSDSKNASERILSPPSAALVIRQTEGCKVWRARSLNADGAGNPESEAGVSSSSPGNSLHVRRQRGLSSGGGSGAWSHWQLRSFCGTPSSFGSFGSFGSLNPSGGRTTPPPHRSQ